MIGKTEFSGMFFLTLCTLTKSAGSLRTRGREFCANYLTRLTGKKRTKTALNIVPIMPDRSEVTDSACRYDSVESVVFPGIKV